MQSIFMDQSVSPSATMLQEALGDTYAFWNELAGYVRTAFPAASEEWKFSGAKYGWSFRISDKKRVLIYLLPRDGFFKMAIVFGQKATDQVLESTVDETIKQELREAKPYAEGRGIRIAVKDEQLIGDLKKLIGIKLEN